MKLKQGFVLRQIAGKNVVIPTDSSLDLNMMITLNSTGVVLWKRLETESEISDLVRALTDRFEIDAASAETHARAFVEKLRKNDLLQ